MGSTRPEKLRLNFSLQLERDALRFPAGRRRVPRRTSPIVIADRCKEATSASDIQTTTPGFGRGRDSSDTTQVSSR